MSTSPERAVTWEAHPKQAELFDVARDGRYRIIGYGGAIRGGKTFGCLALLLTLCRLFPGSRWAVVRVSLPDLRRTSIPSYYKLREEHFPGFAGEINQSDWTATCSNGSQIIFFPESLDTDPDMGRWKGLEVNGFLLEEADELAEKSFYKAIERAGAWIMPKGRQQPPPYVFCTFNPNASWPKRVFYEPWKNGTIASPYAFIPATARDNPSIPAEVREGWKAMPEQEYKRFVEGDWDVLTGRYYDNLDARVHLVPRDRFPAEWPEWWKYFGSYDWGYGHWSPFGAWAHIGEGALLLLDTLWPTRRAQDEETAQQILEFTDGRLIPTRCRKLVFAGQDCWSRATARGASGVTTADIFARVGIWLAEADVDKVNGGRAVRRALAFKRDPESGALTQPPKLFIVDTPANRRVFEQLAEIMPDENDINKPAKVDCDSEGRGGDDGADMVRYGVATWPKHPKEPDDAPIDVFDPAILKAEVEQKYRLGPRLKRKRQRPLDGMFGGF